MSECLDMLEKVYRLACMPENVTEILARHLTGVAPPPGNNFESVFLPRAKVVGEDKIGGKRQPYPPEGQVEVLFEGRWHYMSEIDHDEALRDFYDKRAGSRERKRNFSGEFSRGGQRGGRHHSSPLMMTVREAMMTDITPAHDVIQVPVAMRTVVDATPTLVALTLVKLR